MKIFLRFIGLSFLVAMHAAALAEVSTPDNSLVDSLNQKAESVLDQNPTMAVSAAGRALEISRKQNYKQGEIKALISIAAIDEDSGKYESALKLLQSALRLSNDIADPVLISRSLQNTGNIKNRQGNYEEATNIYLQALNTAEKIRDKKLISDLTNNLAVCYLDMEKYDKALEYHLRALELRKSENWQKEIAASLQNIGNVYFARVMDSLALDYYMQSLDLRRKINDKAGIATSLNCVAAVYVDFEMNDKAVELIQQAIGIRKELGELNKLPQLYENLADIAGNTGDYSASLSYLKQAEESAGSIGAKKELRNIYQSYAVTYEKMNDAGSALKYYKLYTAYKDSILNEKNSMHVNDLIARYETTEKENQIKLQQAEIGKQKAKTYFLSLLILLVIAVGGLLFNRHRLKTKQAMQEEKIRQEQLRLKSMIIAQENERRHIAGELHDGLGQVLSAARLNVESSAQKSGDPKLSKALQLIDTSFSEIRNISHRMMPVQLIRSGLSAAVADMIGDFNKSGSIRFDFNAEEKIPRLEENMEINIFRIVQEWTNNVIKYAGATTVSIQLLYADDELTVMIEDDGKGFDTRLLETGKGNGWYNINSRLSLVNGELEIDSKPGQGTLFTFYVPVRNVVMAAA